MRSSSGLAIGVAIGVVVGATAMYLALEKPWRGGPATASIDAGVPDAGAAPVATKKRGKKKRRGAKSGGARTEVAADPSAPPLTPAEKKLSWKGDSMERPATSMDMESGEEGRALSGGEIEEGIDSGGGALERCVESALGGRVWSGEITIQLLVDGTGRAGKVRVRAPAFMHANDLVACVRSAGKRLDFAATGGYTVVTVPVPIEF